MKRPRLVPAGFDLPVALPENRFSLRPLRMDDLARDFEAYMSCVDYLRTGGYVQPDSMPLFDWPRHDVTVHWALVMLGEIEHAHHYGTRLEYGLFDARETREFGCLYISPSMKAGFDAQVTLWVRESMHEALDSWFYSFARRWVPIGFPFLERLVYPGREISWSEWSELPDTPKVG